MKYAWYVQKDLEKRVTYGFTCENIQVILIRETKVWAHYNLFVLGEKPFLCPECGRAFAQKRILAKHLKIHLDERPFVCTHCNRAFRHRTNLQDHIMIHTGEKPFQCKLCSYACIKRYNLRQHMRKHTDDSNTIDTSTAFV